jgi:hypothetical protein
MSMKSNAKDTWPQVVPTLETKLKFHTESEQCLFTRKISSELKFMTPLE